MRKLKSTDLFAALRVVRAIGIKEEVVALATTLNAQKGGKTQEEVGTELILGLLANCGEKGAENAFYEFLSGPTEIAPEELREMDLMAFANLVKELVVSVDIEAWKDFFHSLVAALKLNLST